MVTYADTNFLQIFLCERFNNITPRPIEFEEVTFTDAIVPGELKKNKSHPYIPKTWRWAVLKQAMNKTLVSVMDTEEEDLSPARSHSSNEHFALTLRRP